jgi:pimeloyl-ACP methyl ester carboxylesterase
MPITADIAPRIAEVTATLNLTNSTVALGARVEFVNDLFASKPTFETELQFLGMSALIPPQVGLLYSSREQDPTEWFEVGKEGFPLLALYGDEDKTLNAAPAIAFVGKNYTNFESHIIKGGGHLLFFEQEKEVSGIILKWFEKVAKK